MREKLTQQELLEQLDKRAIRFSPIQKREINQKLLSREDFKPLIEFTRQYLKSHVYVSSVKLTKAYNNGKKNIPLAQCFGRILTDLRNLGVIEKFNSKQWRRIIDPDNIEALKNE